MEIGVCPFEIQNLSLIHKGPTRIDWKWTKLTLK
jgi:hypothetical protein